MVCKNCGKSKSEHIVIKYEGRVLNETPYICPTGVFEEKPTEKPAAPTTSTASTK